MSATLKGVLFDLDDTLIDWSHSTDAWREKEMRHITGVYEFVIDKGGNLNASVETLHDHFSRRVRDSWVSARATLRSPHLGKILMESLANFGFTSTDEIDMLACIDAYRWGAVEGVTVFPEVPAVLETLRAQGLKVGIVTNAFQPIVMRDIELAEFDLLRHFPDAQGRICAADVGYLKPHPIIFNHALNALDLQPEETVFVGDNVVADIGGAQKAGIKAVLRVNQSESLLSGVIQPDAKITHLGELLPILDAWFAGWR